MIELEQNNYYRVIQLLNEVPFNNYFAGSVVRNKVKGKIFVDSEQTPSACLIVHKYGMSLLCGSDRNDSFNNKVACFLKNDSINISMAKWMLVHPESWCDKLSGLLGKDLLKVPDIKEDEHLRYKESNKVLQTERVNFKFHKNLFVNNSKIPEGFILTRIDSEMYGKISGSVVPQNFWNSAEDFLENGIGFSLLSDDQVVSTCFSSFIIDDKLELGIETAERFRGKGYSIYPALALIEYCLSLGYEPIWACRKENIGSFKLAQKLGFLPFSNHPYYVLPVPPKL